MKKTREKGNLKFIFLISLEVSLILIFLSLFLFPNYVLAGFGENNVTVKTNLSVANSAPVIGQIDIEQGSINLNPNTTKTVNCSVNISDYDGALDIDSVSAVLFSSSSTNYASLDDNNTHYTNSSCDIDTSVGDAFQAISNCLFEVWYNAEAETWNCTVVVNDSSSYQVNDSNTTVVQPLLALGLPDIIQYGEINATYVSLENVTNVSNLGNVELNLSLSGYGFLENDGNAMNCTLGPIRNISIEYEKYNLTSSTTGDLSHSELIGNYTNLTSFPITKRFDLDYRKQEDYHEAWNYTYWRVYVPIGVAGTCQGNIIFGAVQADGT